LIYIP